MPGGNRRESVWRCGSYPPPPESGCSKPSLDWSGSRVAVVGYGVVCLHILLLGVLAVANPQLFNALTGEDHLVENLTAVCYLCAGALFFVVAAFEQRGMARGIYILVGIALVFVAGEEISWGQRVIGLTTPEYLRGINDQEEFNIHNISNRFTDFIAMLYRNSRLALCIVALTALFCGRERLFGIPMPSAPLALAFLTTDAYLTAHNLFNLPAFMFQETKMPLLFLGAYALISRQYKLLLLAVATAAVIAANAYTMLQTSLTLTHPLEVAEYLAGIAFVWYGVELLLSQRRAAILTVMPRSSAKLWAAIGPRPLGSWLCNIAIVASIGLTAVTYSRDVFPEAHFEYAYGANAPFAATEPVAHTEFDIYIHEGRIYYYKEGCTQEDIADTFFLHIIPVQEADLPESRRRHGYENLDFPFKGHGVLLGEKCAAHIELPRYPIDRIHTGQYIQKGPRLWEVAIELPPAR